METIRKAIQFLLAKENRIGAIILLIGLLAFLFVTIKAFNRFTGPSSSSSGVEIVYDERVELQEENFRNFSTSTVNRTQNRTVKKPALKYPRQEDIQESDIQGAWSFSTQKYRYLLQFRAGEYKLVLIPQPGSTGSPFYSVGSYTLKNDLLQLAPISYDQQARTEFPGYQVFTRSGFPLFVRRDGNKLILQKPTREARIYVPPRHPLLREIPDEVAIFVPLK